MKNFNSILLFLAAALLLTFTSCDTTCDCPAPSQGNISQAELDRMIVEVTTTNVSTGFESVFRETITDSTERAYLCQIFVDAARFYDDESGYFFIETLNDAWVVAHINHDLIGTSRIEIKDDYGNFFIQEMVEVVSYTGYGFVQYYRKNPSTEIIEKKVSFVTSIPSANWFIGTGFYGDPPEVEYTYTDAHKKILMEATNTMAKGIGAILQNIYTSQDAGAEFCKGFIDHIRFFENRSGYFFISDMDGITIAHGADPNLEGVDQINLQDTKGAYIIQDMIDIAEVDGSGYYQYFWINPATGNEEEKTTYVKHVPHSNYMICAGFYMN